MFHISTNTEGKDLNQTLKKHSSLLLVFLSILSVKQACWTSNHSCHNGRIEYLWYKSVFLIYNLFVINHVWLTLLPQRSRSLQQSGNNFPVLITNYPCYTLFLDAANNLCQPAVVTHMDFYNMALDNLDLMKEYEAWQDPNTASG